METTAILFLIVRIILICLLFGFVGVAVYIFWREVNFHQQKVSKSLAPTIAITEIRQPTTNHVFYNQEVIIGRDPACDFRLNEATLSARHARLSFHHNQWWIEDLGSSNGTYLNKQLVVTPVVITSNDHLRCGETDMVIEIDVE